MTPTQLAANGKHIASFSSNDFLWITPIVEDRTKWEEFHSNNKSGSIVPTIPYIFAYDDGDIHPVNRTGPFVPIHQMYCTNCSVISSAINTSMINYDMGSDIDIMNDINYIVSTNTSMLSGLVTFSLVRDLYYELFDADKPLSVFIAPIKDTYNRTNVVGYIHSLVEWKYVLSNLNWGTEWVTCEVVNTREESFYFKAYDNVVEFIGYEDFEKSRYRNVYASAAIATEDNGSLGLDAAKEAGICIYTITIYATKNYRNDFNMYAGLYTSIVGITMLVMVGSFIAYDQYV
jgi:hypothetical protein